MKIATFNANSIRSRLEVVINWLKTYNPDVLCIQETKVTDDLFPAAAFLEAGYSVVFKGQKSYNGVCLVSRQPATEVRFGLDDGGQPDESRLVSARVGSVWIVNTYVPQGREIGHEMYGYKLEWFRRLRKHFERHFKPMQKVAWVGDLNVAPEEKDIHNASEQADHVCFHVDVRKAFEEVKNWGFKDVFRKYHPEPGQYTFFDYRTMGAVKRGMGWRVDHILATSSLAAKSTDSYVDLEPRLAAKSSDHTFLVAEFDLD
ncbi:MAG: exodeoxyribonuclease III [bacterium]